ncbi:uncharacterized protein LOC142981882 [Anticarsia gemmatalis]|uniref:uncharacterized protein LOC142981882 n=1 Tax=Anticarsia gemmatalis TaxID=129554 RepID=UPI003F773AFC
METTMSFSALFFKTKVNGLFRVIPSLAFEYAHLPEVTFGLKVVDPGYLGIMNCKYHLAYGLAPADRMPTNETCDAEAKKIGFVGSFQFCYLNMPPTHPSMPDREEFHDDDEENMHLEVIRNYNEHIDSSFI